jgi:hypothetical protein
MAQLAPPNRAGVQQVAPGSSTPAAFRRPGPAFDRRALARGPPKADSAAIDTDMTPHKEPTMHTSLPTPTRAARLNALAAAFVVTLTMLAGIAQLADADSAPLLAGAASAQRA